MQISSELWAFENNLLDLLMMFVHLVVWSLVLMMIEKNKLAKIKCCAKQDMPQPLAENDLDEDVLLENQRIKS